MLYASSALVNVRRFYLKQKYPFLRTYRVSQKTAKAFLTLKGQYGFYNVGNPFLAYFSYFFTLHVLETTFSISKSPEFEKSICPTGFPIHLIMQDRAKWQKYYGAPLR